MIRTEKVQSTFFPPIFFAIHGTHSRLHLHNKKKQITTTITTDKRNKTYKIIVYFYYIYFYLSTAACRPPSEQEKKNPVAFRQLICVLTRVVCFMEALNGTWKGANYRLTIWWVGIFFSCTFINRPTFTSTKWINTSRLTSRSEKPTFLDPQSPETPPLYDKPSELQQT